MAENKVKIDDLNIWSIDIIKYFTGIVFLAIGYIIFGKVGQMLALNQVTPIWPSSGIAIAGLLLYGYRLWPGIWLGSFMINTTYNTYSLEFFSTEASMLCAALIATGTTSSALLGTYLLNRMSSVLKLLSSVRYMVSFLLWGGGVSTFVAATVGTTALTLFHFISKQAYSSTWQTWWIGDGIGVIIFAPLILSLYKKPWLNWKKEEFLEFLLLSALIIGIGAFRYHDYPIRYLMLPCIIIAAFRMGTARMMMLVVLVAIIETGIDFQGTDLLSLRIHNDLLLMTQIFIGVVAGTGLILSAVLEERAQQSDELKRMMKEAEAANRIKSSFLANMSHELRTPLNAIIGYSEMLIEDDETAANIKDYKNTQEKVLISAKSLLELINGVLDLSKVEAGKIDICLENIKISDLMKELNLIMLPILKKNNNILEIKCKIDETSPYNIIRTDIAILRQSLLNLLSNAAKFSHDSVIRFEITSLSEKTKKYIKFRVIDKGIGIPKAMLENLFQAFYQIDGSTTRKYGGTGLGLYLTREFCKLLNGRISVKSEEGKGSEFTLILPCV